VESYLSERLTTANRATALLADRGRLGSSGSSKRVWAVAELPAVPDRVWEGVWPGRLCILSAWRSHAFSALGVAVAAVARMWL